MSNSDDLAEQPQEDVSVLRGRGADHIHVPAQSSSSNTSRTVSPRPGHRRLVFSDPVAFRYFEGDPTTTVLERRRKLRGYEIYIVEQWACSRTHPTCVVTTYTGDSTHSISVGVLSVPRDDSTWSPRLKLYFKAMFEYYAREQETPLGLLMVTNLSGLPSSLSVIFIPDGDVRKHREDFIVNENLKRLGCAGRAGLHLQAPQPSTIAKFHHLFRTREHLHLYTSVMELVKLCQVSLILYGKLAPVYADGLLCDLTEKSINEWWSDIGTYIYNIDPNSNALDSSTVSALIGLLMGAFNRLKTFGAPIGKDVFDISSTKRAIAYFQKSQKMERTRRLDRQTLMKLHKVTAKTASGEGWTVPKAVKSTVAELSGKGGEMVMGIVRARDKAGIAEVETLDIESLAHLVTGAKARWLWQGKATRPTPADSSGPFSPSDNDKVFGTDDRGNYIWTGTQRDSVPADDSIRKADQIDDQENKTGFERFKDVVGLPGLRSHQPKQSKDWVKPNVVNSPDILDSSEQAARDIVPKPPLPDTHASESLDTTEQPARKDTAPKTASSPELKTLRMSVSSQAASSPRVSEELKSRGLMASADLGSRSQTPSNQLKAAKYAPPSSTQKEISLMPQEHKSNASSLRRSRSSIQGVSVPSDASSFTGFPRCLSFSAIESIVLSDGDIEEEANNKLIEIQDPRKAIVHEEANAFFLQDKVEKISNIEQFTLPYTQRQLQEIDDLNQSSQKQQKELHTAYQQRLEVYQTQNTTVSDMMVDERQGLYEVLRRVEMLEAKLDYELDALTSRAEEVEHGVTEFERSVRNIESRVDELDDESPRTSPWWLNLNRIFTAGKV